MASGRDLIGGSELRHLDACAETLAWLARELQSVRRTIDHAQPFPDVCQPNPVRYRLIQRVQHHAHPVVVDLDDGAPALAPTADGDRAGSDLARKAMLDRVLDERL